MSWLFCGGVGVTVLPVVVDYFLRCAHREKIREDSYNYDDFSLKHMVTGFHNLMFFVPVTSGGKKSLLSCCYPGMFTAADCSRV